MNEPPRDSIKILHISDLHCGERFDPNPLGERSGKERSDELLEKTCSSVYETLKNTLDYIDVVPRDIDLLVISGDLTNSGREIEYDSILAHTIKPLSMLFKRILIVPGNHDVDWRQRSHESPRLQGRTLHGYQRCFKNNHELRQSEHTHYYFAPTPENTKLEDASLGRSDWCQVIPFNSVNYGGMLDPKVKEHLDSLAEDAPGGDSVARIDPAFVSPADMEQCRQLLSHEGEKPLIRIAVVHHNPLPYVGEDSNPKPYRFMNDASFIKFLKDNGFNLVLHGHQHTHDAMFFSNVNGAPDLYHLPLRTGLVCVGAPSFGASDSDGYGLHLLAIDKDERHFVRVTSRCISRKHTRAATDAPRSIESKYVFPGKINSQIERLLSQTSEAILKGEKLDELARLVDPNPPETAFFRQMRKSRSDHKAIKAIYSVSVFPPELWGEKRLAEFFLPEARRNIAIAAARAKNLEARQLKRPRKDAQRYTQLQRALRDRLERVLPTLHFSFSRPVGKAIQTAQGISKQLRISELVARWLQADAPTVGDTLFTQDRGFLMRTSRNRDTSNVMVNACSSMSIWDDVRDLSDLVLNGDMSIDIQSAERVVGHGAVSGTQIEVSQNSFELSGYPPAASKHPDVIGTLSEFPRVLLWDERCFDSPAALPCIEFHENCGFPLFWIRPQSLLDARGGQRRIYGHYTILNASADRLDSYSDWNDALGNRPSFEDFPEDRVNWIWNYSPPWTAPAQTTFLSEFTYLLERPDVMFAADVWAMRKAGLWPMLTKHLDGLWQREGSPSEPPQPGAGSRTGNPGTGGAEQLEAGVVSLVNANGKQRPKPIAPR